MGQIRESRPSLLDRFKRRRAKTSTGGSEVQADSSTYNFATSSSSTFPIAAKEIPPPPYDASPDPSIISTRPPIISEVKKTPIIVNTVVVPSSPDASSSLFADSSTPTRPPSSSGEFERTDDLWTNAYQSLKFDDETGKLVQAYEKLLTSLHKNDIDVLGLSDDAPNMLDCDAAQRVARMQEMTKLSLEKAKRHTNVYQAVEQVGNFVEITSYAVSSMLAAYPPASLAWSGICAILSIIAAPSTQQLAMRDGLFYVMEKMEWYMAISRLTLDDMTHNSRGILSLRDLTKFKIGSLFQTLLEFEIKAVCTIHGLSPLTRALRAILLIDDWNTRLDQVKSLEAEISGYLVQVNSAATTTALIQISQDTAKLSGVLRELKNIREQGNDERLRAEESRRLELIGRFSTETTCPYLDRMMAVSKRVPGTCEWFQTHNKYRDWLGSPDGGLLLLSADPGCGKSVLSRFLVDEILPVKMPRDTICYFFFKDSPDQNNTPAALCALIHQILSSKPALTDTIRAEILENGNALTVKERVLWKIFEKLTLTLQKQGSSVVCVLDALDECQRDGRLSIVEHVQSLVQRNANMAPKPGEPPLGKVKFLITTRGYPEIVKLFQDFSRGCILLAGENKAEVSQIQSEIAMVANHRLDQLAVDRGFSAKRKAEIHQILAEKGGQQRTYLWVRLVFEVLEANLRDQLFVWKRIINTLPQTVYDAYDKLLERVSDSDRDRVMMLLRLMIAAFRPIPLRTAILLLDARDFADYSLDNDELDEGDDEDDEDEEPEWESEQGFTAWVLGTCGIFVTIYDQQLFFIHQTAKEFLQASGKLTTTPVHSPKSPLLPTFRHSITEKEAHRTMAENCIALWKYGTKARINWDDERAKDDGYRYCVELWAEHFREAQVFSSTAKGLPSPAGDDEAFSGSSSELVSDIDPRFWDTYLALWNDATFIRAQHLGSFLAWYDKDAYFVPAEFTDESRLAFIATYGHYRLLNTELRRLVPSGLLEPDALPSTLPAEGTGKDQCTRLLLRHVPMRPVIIVSDNN
ncbi:hypothetical protein B0H63DRAFT_464007 [Podospora didyma]|uniref:NWD NACHT-NTPase N-terminal domain-containing protein n=1 Tax=Podospora didyma TaxID=330526 RepID=A0AAE0NY78_9PEZI|nr:hypothetical protein B0H63DRAFT_464007 [Podospora didyma]